MIFLLYNIYDTFVRLIKLNEVFKMKLKKIIAVALAAATLGCSVVFSASAAGTDSAAKTLNLKRGQVVTANMYVSLDSSSPTTDISGVQVRLQYDNTAMKYTTYVDNDGVTKDGPFSTEFKTGSWLCNPHPPKDGEGNFLSSAMNWGPSAGYDLSSKKLIAQVNFDVTTSATSAFASKLEELYANDDNVSDLLSYGKINLQFFVNGYELGDVNTDGNITISDSITLQKIIANITSPQEIQETLGDCNGDGNITIADAITVQKRIANIIEFI